MKVNYFTSLNFSFLTWENKPKIHTYFLTPMLTFSHTIMWPYARKFLEDVPELGRGLDWWPYRSHPAQRFYDTDQQDTSCVESNSKTTDFLEPPAGRGSPLRANKGTSSFGSNPASDSGQRQLEYHKEHQRTESGPGTRRRMEGKSWSAVKQINNL